MAPVPRPTARQLLRPFSVDDAPGILALNADPLVVKWVDNGPFESLDQARQFLAAYNPYETEGMGRWAALDLATGAFLGFCGLRRQGDEVDLGYRYHRHLWGQGLATEASAACLDLAFGELGLASVIARAHPDNAASVRVMVKLGFQHEGACTGGPEPCVQYRITADAWRARTTPDPSRLQDRPQPG